LKHTINAYRIEHRDGTGYYDDRRRETESTGKYVGRPRAVVYSSETPQ
jgi:hypothetical protein